MSARTLGAFALGFAVGVLCLGLGLWGTGRLRTSAAAPAPLAWQPQPAPVVQEPLLDKLDQGVAQLPKPGLEPPPDLITAVPDTHGDADRSLPDIPQGPAIAIPLAGIDKKKLSESFHQPRDGHQHEALDIMAPRGTPVLAVAEGNVAKLFESKQGGHTVYQFDNSGRWCFYYAHLDRYAKGLREGVLLRTGDVLGYVGSTGDAAPNAPHLHLAVFRMGPEKHWWQGTAVDPLPLLR